MIGKYIRNGTFWGISISVQPTCRIELASCKRHTHTHIIYIYTYAALIYNISIREITENIVAACRDILSPGHYVFGVRAILLKSGQLEDAEMLWASSVSSPVLISDVDVNPRMAKPWLIKGLAPKIC
jgi:transketolase N-terminal domain/subunit